MFYEKINITSSFICSRWANIFLYLLFISYISNIMCQRLIKYCRFESEIEIFYESNTYKVYLVMLRPYFRVKSHF